MGFWVGQGQSRRPLGQALGAKSAIIFIPLVMAHGPGLTMPSVPPTPGPPQFSFWQALRVTVEHLGKEERSGDPFLDWYWLTPHSPSRGQRLCGRFA